MKQRDILQKQMTPVQIYDRKNPLADQSVLGGLPLRPVHNIGILHSSDDRLAFLMWLRIPLLLLGVVGALGLLAYYKPWFAEASSMIRWPDWRISVAFLGLAGCVFVVLLADWFYVTALKCIRFYQRRNESGQTNWRCR
jgi:hypothetical protein